MRDLLDTEPILCPYCKDNLVFKISHGEILTHLRFSCPHCHRAISRDVPASEVKNNELWLDHVCAAIEKDLTSAQSYFQFR